MARKNRSREEAIERVEQRIVDVREAEPFVKILVYGRNGQGKTRFAATAPSPLVVDINEKGTRSVRGYKGVRVFPVRNWEDLTHVYWFLRQGNHEYESVILDSVTAASQLCMTQVLKEGFDRDPNRDPKLPAQRDWGKVSELMKGILLNYRNLPMHVVFTTQERVMGDDDDEFQEHVPDLSKAIRGIACGSVEVIGRIYQKEVRSVDKKTKKEKVGWEPRMLVGPHEAYVTKDRTGILPRVVRNPTVPKIIEAAFQVEE